MQVSGYRYYSPGLGRWANRDPAEEWGGVSLFAFLANRVADQVDVLGKCSLRTIAAAYRAYHTARNNLPGAPFTTTTGTMPYRHCFWNCRMRKSLGGGTAGEIFARTMSDLKEQLDNDMCDIRDGLVRDGCYGRLARSGPGRALLQQLQNACNSANQASDYADNATGRQCGHRCETRTCAQCCTDNGIGPSTPDGPPTRRWGRRADLPSPLPPWPNGPGIQLPWPWRPWWR
ncbi:MAG: hypothetical protein HN742_18370 [Lentisphaerae bacterium]|jgi:hypothetical protein|nr:hypothetical protein [Lentisphaerota bacterium]MBT5606802.1 hypothetical protein [Lentisphaerota bacterium]MBT7061598.1 hypothetical protein [Lentisphaerota bacterium]MBT7843851.1 hypothetical protein [Lentisphaerota bacterium]